MRLKKEMLFAGTERAGLGEGGRKKLVFISGPAKSC